MKVLQTPLCKTVVKYTSLSLLALGLSGCVVETPVHHPPSPRPRPAVVVHKAPRPVVVHKPRHAKPVPKPVHKAPRSFRKPAVKPAKPAGRPAGKPAPGKPMPGPRR